MSFLPSLEPFPWTGDNRCKAIVNEFLSDHDTSEILGFYQLFVDDNAQGHTVGLDDGLPPIDKHLSVQNRNLLPDFSVGLVVGVTTPQAFSPVQQSFLWSIFSASWV